METLNEKYYNDNGIFFNLDSNLELANKVHELGFREGERFGKKSEHEKCTVGCPFYNSGHSISADGSCNMGCC